MAHELGHYFIDTHRQALQSGVAPSHLSSVDHESKNPVEREADHFAANLLMPRVRFSKATKTMPPGLESIVALSKEFGTSLTSTAIRYASLDIIPCAVIKWSSDGLGWKWISGSLWGEGYKATYHELERVPKDSATGRALDVARPEAVEILRTGATARQWFPYCGPGTRGNPILVEEAISLGQYGALTLLRFDSR